MIRLSASFFQEMAREALGCAAPRCVERRPIVDPFLRAVGDAKALLVGELATGRHATKLSDEGGGIGLGGQGVTSIRGREDAAGGVCRAPAATKGRTVNTPGRARERRDGRYVTPAGNAGRVMASPQPADTHLSAGSPSPLTKRQVRIAMAVTPPGRHATARRTPARHGLDCREDT